jgi:hypothetical protein
MKADYAQPHYLHEKARMGKPGGTWNPLHFGVIGEAWGLYLRDAGLWTLTTLVALGGYGCLQWFTHLIFGSPSGGLFSVHNLAGYRGPTIFEMIVGSLVMGLFLGGMIRMAVIQVRGGHPMLGDLFKLGDVWFDLLLGSALMGVCNGVGWTFLIIPGVIISGLLMLTYPLIVDAHLPATGAMIQSFELLKSHWLMAGVLHFAIILAAASGLLFCGLGILFTAPLYALSIALIYRDLYLDANLREPSPFGDFQGDPR